MLIEVIYCPAPHSTDLVMLQLDEGATVKSAIEASGVLVRHRLELASLRVGVWGRAVSPQTPLREADRVELYRPLLVDPKEARRLRYKRSRVAQR